MCSNFLHYRLAQTVSSRHTAHHTGATEFHGLVTLALSFTLLDKSLDLALDFSYVCFVSYPGRCCFPWPCFCFAGTLLIPRLHFFFCFSCMVRLACSGATDHERFWPSSCFELYHISSAQPSSTVKSWSIISYFQWTIRYILELICCSC